MPQQVISAFCTHARSDIPKQKPFDLTDIQKAARQMIIDHPESDQFLMVGGSRSGKTFGNICFLITRARMYPRSRHLVCRLRFNHAKASIWMDTLPKALRLMNLKAGRDYTLNKTDFVVTFSNGSELWIDGLDNAERVEKMLGREYNTVYFNEISQISYDSVTTVLSRLALLSVSDTWGECRNYALYDCNPPSKHHWSYQLWHLNRDPEKRLPLKPEQAAKYQHIKMNPTDNLQNLGKGYLEKLENLPERKRKRFLDGDYSDVEGAIFSNWTVISAIPDEVHELAKVRIGCDYGFTADCAAAVRVWYQRRFTGKSRLYIEELVYEKGLSNKRLMRAIDNGCLALDKKEAYRQYLASGGVLPEDEWWLENAEIIESRGRTSVKCMCDGAEPKDVYEMQEYVREASLPFIIIGVKAKTEIVTGIDWMEDLDIYITQASEHVIEEFESYEWKKDAEGQALPEPVDKYNHTIDSIRYACHEFIGSSSAQIVTLSAG